MCCFQGDITKRDLLILSKINIVIRPIISKSFITILAYFMTFVYDGDLRFGEFKFNKVGQ